MGSAESPTPRPWVAYREAPEPISSLRPRPVTRCSLIPSAVIHRLVLGGQFMILAATAAGADVFVGKQVNAGDRVPVNQIDHTVFDGLLSRFVDADGMVAYRNWHADQAARAELTGYLETLSAAKVDADLKSGAPAERDAALAFWINAYNAVTIEGILRVYPTTSIRNHTASLWGYNVWKNLKLRVGGAGVSLDDMEHRRLRLMDEPRIHFAIVCASKGCPRLLNEAYVADRLDEQLERNAAHFFAQPANFRVDTETQTVYLSSILKWFGEDFGRDQHDVLASVRQWTPEATLTDELLRARPRVRYLDYDWTLNEQ